MLNLNKCPPKALCSTYEQKQIHVAYKQNVSSQPANVNDLLMKSNFYFCVTECSKLSYRHCFLTIDLKFWNLNCIKCIFFQKRSSTKFSNYLPLTLGVLVTGFFGICLIIISEWAPLSDGLLTRV